MTGLQALFALLWSLGLVFAWMFGKISGRSELYLEMADLKAENDKLIQQLNAARQANWSDDVKS